MFLTKKQGIAASQLVVVILTVAAFMLVAGEITRAYAQAEDKDAEILCHDSVAIRAATAFQINPNTGDDDSYLKLVEGTIKAAPALCKTIDKKVEGDKQKVMALVADKMAACWQMFGEGKYEQVLSGSKIKVLPTIFNLGESPNKCFNCYTIIVGDIEDGEISPQEMMNFLSTETHKKSGKTYTDYIQSVGGPGRVVYYVVSDSFSVEGIKPNHAYSISYLPKLPAVPEGRALEGAAKLGIAASGIGIGTVVMGVVTLTTPVGWALGIAAAAGLALTATSGINDIVQATYADSEFRQVSSIYLSTLKQGQQWCGSGDIAGR